MDASGASILCLSRRVSKLRGESVKPFWLIMSFRSRSSFCSLVTWKGVGPTLNKHHEKYQSLYILKTLTFFCVFFFSSISIHYFCLKYKNIYENISDSLVSLTKCLDSKYSWRPISRTLPTSLSPSFTPHLPPLPLSQSLPPFSSPLSLSLPPPLSLSLSLFLCTYLPSLSPLSLFLFPVSIPLSLIVSLSLSPFPLSLFSLLSLSFSFPSLTPASFTHLTLSSSSMATRLFLCSTTSSSSSSSLPSSAISPSVLLLSAKTNMPALIVLLLKKTSIGVKAHLKLNQKWSTECDAFVRE